VGVHSIFQNYSISFKSGFSKKLIIDCIKILIGLKCQFSGFFNNLEEDEMVDRVSNQTELSYSKLINQKPNLKYQTSLEMETEHLAGAEKISMMYGNPNSELFLALLARAVTFLIRGVSTHPNTEIKGNLDFKKASSMTLEELLKVREEQI